jgi:DNA processing protein
MSDREYLVAVSSFIPFGPARIKLLLSYFGSAKKIWQAEKSKLIKLGLGEQRTADFVKYREELNCQKYFAKLEKLSIGCFTFSDKAYPPNLKDLPNAPIVLYIKGKLKVSDINAVAIVGSRKMTAYGREVTGKFSSELASFGVTVVSGLARGIDTEAHQAALSVGGRTIAVLGCGLDLVYPPENTQLASEIVHSGALLSEYPLGYPAIPLNFASRNRIISGLAKAVLVIEGAEKSGTLLTASHAAEQGRTVFAVPGQITSPLSGAPLFLIKNGAKMATSTKDILEELDIQIKVDREVVEKILPASPEEEKILAILENENLHLDEIARISSLATSIISARLTMMELKGLVKSLGGGIYKKCS